MNGQVSDFRLIESLCGFLCMLIRAYRDLPVKKKQLRKAAPIYLRHRSVAPEPLVELQGWVCVLRRSQSGEFHLGAPPHDPRRQGLGLLFGSAGRGGSCAR